MLAIGDFTLSVNIKSHKSIQHERESNRLLYDPQNIRFAVLRYARIAFYIHCDNAGAHKSFPEEFCIISAGDLMGFSVIRSNLTKWLIRMNVYNLI